MRSRFRQQVRPRAIRRSAAQLGGWHRTIRRLAAIRRSPCLSCRIPLRCAHTPLRLTGAYARTHHHPLSLLHDCACAVLYECLSHATCVHVFVCSCSRVSVGLCPSACVRRLAQGTGGTRFPRAASPLCETTSSSSINIHPKQRDGYTTRTLVVRGAKPSTRIPKGGFCSGEAPQ